MGSAEDIDFLLNPSTPLPPVRPAQPFELNGYTLYNVLGQLYFGRDAEEVTLHHYARTGQQMPDGEEAETVAISPANKGRIREKFNAREPLPYWLGSAN